MQNRRTFMKSAALAAAAISAGQVVNAKQSSINPFPSMGEDDGLFFKISLAQWSLNRKIRGGDLDNLDFPAYAKDNFGIHAVEYVDKFFPSVDKEYIKGLLKRTEDIGVKNAGFRGYIGIEYEGRTLGADDGIKATKDLLIKAGKSLM